MTIDLAALKKTLDGRIGSDGSLSLDATLLPDGAVQSFLEFLPGKSLPLTGAKTSLSTDGGAVLGITGTLSAPWTLPALPDFPLTGISLSATFSQKTPADAVDSQLNVLQASLGGKFPVSGTLGTDGRMTVSLAPGRPAISLSLADMTALASASTVSMEQADGIPFFNTLPLTGLSAAFCFDPAKPVTLLAASDMKADWKILPDGLFDLKGVGFSFQTDFTPQDGGAWGAAFSGQLQASTHIVQDMDVTLALGPSDWVLDVAPKQGGALPALSDLAGVLGGDSLRKTVAGGLNALGLDTLTLDGIQVAFDPVAKKLSYVSCDAHMMLAGGRVSLNVRLPDFSFTGGLPNAPKGQASAPNPNRISLKDLLALKISPSGDFPDIDVTALTLFAQPSQGAYRLGVQVESDWTLSLGPAGPSFTLSMAEVVLQKNPRQMSGSLSAGLSLAGFDLFLSGNCDGGNNGWSFTAEGGGPSVPLGQCLSSLAMALGTPLPHAWTGGLPDLQIQWLSVSYDAGTKAFHISASVQGKGSIPLGLGPCDADLRVNLTCAPDPATQKRAFTGSMEADIIIGAAHFTVEYDLGPAGKIFTGRWSQTNGETIGLEDLAKAVGLPGGISIPQGLDLALTQAAFTFDSTTQNLALSASSKNYGDAFFALAQGTDEKWGCLFGVDFPPGAKLSSLPVVGKGLEAADFLTFHKAAFLVCTGTYANYTLPAFPNLLAPPAKAGGPPSTRPAQSTAAGALLQLTPGLFLVGVADLSKAAGPEVKHLVSLAGKDQLALQLGLNASSLQLTASLAGSVNIPAGKGTLVLSAPTVTITLSATPGFQFSGTMDIPIHGATIQARAAIALTTTGANVLVTVQSTTPLPPPPGLKGLHFQQFGMEMGLLFEPPALDLGFSGKFTLGDTTPSDDTFALVLELVADVPNLLYLSFSADTMNIGQILTLFTGQDASASNPYLSGLQATEVFFSWAELPNITLPDGTQAPVGLAFSGNVQVLGLQAHADMSIGATGLSGHLQLAPIAIGKAFKLGGDGKDITRTFQQVKGQWVKVDNRNFVRQRSPAATKNQILVPGGGVSISANTAASPFLSATISATLFDSDTFHTGASIDASGFAFLFTSKVGKIGDMTLNCVFGDKECLKASGKLNLQLTGDVGPIVISGANCGSVHLNAALQDGTLSLTLSPQEFSLLINGSFSFQGGKLSIPQVSVDIPLSSLLQLPEKVLESIGTEASTLFADLFKDMKTWADAAAAGLVKGYDDAAKVLDSVYKAGVHDAAAVMKRIGEGATKTAKGLHEVYKQSSRDVAAVMKKAGFPPKEVAEGLKGAFSDITPQQMTEEMIGVGFALTDVSAAVVAIFGSAVDTASDWWQKIFGKK